MWKKENLAAYIVAIVVVLLLSFLVTGGIVWVVCWAFHWTFRWSLVVAVWLLWLVARGVFNRGESMDEYIKRGQAKRAACEGCNAEFGEDACEPCDCSLMGAIDEIPAADVRPVVLCCDCKHFQVNVSPSGYLPQGVPEWECRHWLRPTDPTDFCSYGVKMEES